MNPIKAITIKWVIIALVTYGAKLYVKKAGVR